MEWIEVTGRTVAEASAAAAEQLGVSLADAEVEVIEEERWGLFGRLRQEARVRARVRPAVPRPRQERRRRGARRSPSDQGERNGGEAAGDASVEAPGEGRADGDGRVDGDGVSSRPRADRSGRRSDRVKPTGVNGRQAADEQVDGSGETKADGAGTASGRARRRRRPGGSSGSRLRAGEAPSTAAEEGAVATEQPSLGSSAPRREEDGVTVEQDRAAVTAAAIAFVRGLLDMLGLEAEVSAGEDDGALLIEVEGPGLGVLVGPKGATLAALQELLRVVLRRQLEGEVGLVYLDVAQYRRRRREALERFAQSVAAEVVRTGEPRALEAMSAADRRIVHTALLSVPGVATRSDGAEPLRRVIVFPEPTPASPAE